VEQLEVLSNSFSHARFNINMKGNLVLKDNELKNSSNSSALLLADVNSATIEDNRIVSQNTTAIAIRKPAKNVRLIGNTIVSAGPAIFDEGSPSLLIQDNKIELIQGGTESLTLKSNFPDGLRLEGNEHHGTEGKPALVFVGRGTATVNEKLVIGTADYADVEVKKD
jgi:Right handed beta helix region